jgi:hypothetical protein
MIQSRPQFGYVGALLVWLFAFLQYAGFNIFNTVLAGNAITGRSTWLGRRSVLVLAITRRRGRRDSATTSSRDGRYLTCMSRSSSSAC